MTRRPKLLVITAVCTVAAMAAAWAFSTSVISMPKMRKDILLHQINLWQPAQNLPSVEFKFDNKDNRENATAWTFTSNGANPRRFTLIRFKANPIPYDIAAETIATLLHIPGNTLVGARAGSATFAIQKKAPDGTNEVIIWKLAKTETDETWANSCAFTFKSEDETNAFIKNKIPRVLSNLDKQNLLVAPTDLTWP